MVRPVLDQDLYGEDGYIHLELRYNTYEDTTGIPSSATASYNLNSLNITPDTKGIKLQLNSEEKGEVEVVFEQKDFNKSAVKMEDMDLSKMQLK